MIPKKRSLIFLITIFLLLIASFGLSHLFLFKILDRGIRHYWVKITESCARDKVFAYWSFDEPNVTNLLDNHVNKNAGTMLVSGKYGNGRWFYGRPDNIVYTGKNFKELGDSYTFSFWIKLFDPTQDQSILRNRPGTIDYIRVKNGKLCFRVLGTDHKDQDFSFPVSQYGEFIHVAWTADYQKKEIHLYENGIAKVSAELEDSYNRLEEMVFGQIKSGQPLNFILDEIILRRRVLTASEILHESRSKVSLPYRINAGQTLKLRFFQWLFHTSQTGLNGIDLLNPFYHESRIHKAGLPQFNLILSNKDMKAINRFHYLSTHHGIVPEKISTSRKIKVEKDGRLFATRIELSGEAHRLSKNGKKTFSIEFLEDDQYKGMKKIMFVPPETNGLLRALFECRHAKKYHLLFPKGDLGVVLINGIYQGLYYFEDAGSFKYSGDYREPWRIEPLLKEVPVYKKGLLTEYDDLAKTYIPLLMRDRPSFLSSREVLYRVKEDRNQIENLPLDDSIKNAQAHLEKVKTCLTERIVLGNNPAPNYILEPLDFSLNEIDGVEIEWITDAPDIIDKEGRVFRPLDRSVEVTVQARLSYETLNDTKTLKFTIMPIKLNFPIIKLFSRGKITAFEWSPCQVAWTENLGKKQGDVISGKVKLHGNTALNYPKKSFKIRMNWAKKFMDFAPARDLVLMSSYSDYSLMHNQMAYDLFRSLSKSHHQEFAPKHYLIELFLDDEYQGVYEICENVDAHLLGLNVFKKNESNHSVLYKAVMRYANFAVIAPGFYEQKEPDLKFGEYWQPYEELVKFVGKTSSNVFRRDVEKIIDVENAIDFQILLALTGQMDGPDHNLFIARNNRPGDKFFIVPWDYDKSFGGPYFRNRISSLSHRLMKDFPEYIPALQARWSELRLSVLSEASLMDRVDGIEDKIRDAASRNFKLWPIPDGKTHEVVVQEMKDWIKKRLVFLDEYMTSLGTKQ